jgi:glyoxylase-like metal-dependent hydrolase (beta-lactamase superfamily II)
VLERLKLGSTEITVVCEGYAPLDLANELPNVDWAAERERYPWAFHDERFSAWHVHAFALRTPAGLVLIDTGVSPLLPIQPWAAHTPIEDALAAAAVDPAEVTTVIHTHLHADHAGGAVVAGEPRFPNAVHAAHPPTGNPSAWWAATRRGPRWSGLPSSTCLTSIRTIARSGRASAWFTPPGTRRAIGWRSCPRHGLGPVHRRSPAHAGPGPALERPLEP